MANGLIGTMYKVHGKKGEFFVDKSSIICNRDLPGTIALGRLRKKDRLEANVA